MIYAPVANAYRLICDTCELESTEGFLSFREAVDWAKEHAWKAHYDPVTREWEHECPSCNTDLPQEPGPM